MNGRPLLRARRAAGLAVASLVAVAALSASLVAGATPVGVWIDQPLPGSILAFAPAPVTIHAASSGGISKVRLLADGLPVAEVSAPSGDLVTIEWTWVPVAMGEHLLTAIAVGVDGAFSEPTSVGVTFVARDQLPPQPSAAPTSGPTLGPGQTTGPGATAGATQGPGATRTPAPAPTPTKKPTPAPTVCSPPVAILDQPADFAQFDYPSQANPLFEWHYSGGTGCIASQVFNVYNQVLGFDLTVELGAGDRSYQRRTDFLWDPDNPDQQCAHYHWSVTALNSVGDGEPSASGSFDICELNPDA